MGDRIAILKEGGHLAQYAPPAELLMAPADEFVEQFVGADRALKRLALQRVKDVDLIKVAQIRAGESVAEARAKCDESDVDLAMMVDDNGRPLGWLSQRAFTGERIRKDFRSPAEPVIDLDDILRDALGHLLSNETRYGPVVDGRGRMVGVLSMDTIGHSLHVPAEETRTSTELLADE
jgi:osmoprotectant transport system ATP-binding protein